jgi:hypothetical protein
MKREYKVRLLQDNTYEVIEVVTVYGERTSAYDSERSTVTENKVYQGNLSDCEAYIRLHEGGYM